MPGGFTFSAVQVGSGHACALRSTKQLYCWGKNDEGQLGLGTTGPENMTPTVVAGGLLFDSIAAGSKHNCAKATNGFLYCWGLNSHGQLGDGTSVPFSTSPRPVMGQPQLSTLAAGGSHSCYLWLGGALSCWGNNAFGQLGINSTTSKKVPSSGSPLKFGSLTLGLYHSCGIVSGRVYCWGLNNQGQVGDGTAPNNRLVPTQVMGITNVSLVTAGRNHTCALADGGAAYCWGDNSTGQIGDNTSVARRTVPTVTLGGVAFQQLSAGKAHTCGVNNSGDAFCWGSNAAGQLGDGTNTTRPRPTQIAGASYALVAAGGNFTCGLTNGGVAYCWGNNTAGQLGDGTTRSSAAPRSAVGTGMTFKSITAGAEHACGLTTDGAAYCWGNNTQGRLGDGTQTNRTLPVAVSGGIVFSELRAGDVHTCGLTATRGEYCWGSNAEGRIGDGTSVAVRLTPVSIASGSLSYASLAAGANHTCAVTSTKRIGCWGSNDSGQLGDGTTVDRRSLVEVPDADWDSIAAGQSHTCARKSPSFFLYCWGNNQFGQLGDGTNAQRLTPTPVAAELRVSAITAGADHTCANRHKAHAYCWGRNELGKLGTGNRVDASSPVAVPSLIYIQSLAAGKVHTCAVNASRVYCWGGSRLGQGGLGDQSIWGPSFLPVQLEVPSNP